METKYVFNPAYLMFNDKKRIIITDSIYVEKDPLAKKEFRFNAHPICAMFVAMFDGQHSFEETIHKASINLDMDEKILTSVAKNLIDNPQEKVITFGEINSFFPRRTLIRKDEAEKLFGLIRTYKIRDLFISNDSIDMETERFFRPLEVTLVLNLKCTTDCVYCYADRTKTHTLLPTKRIIELVDEAKNIGMRNIELTGGEVFLHKDWELILKQITQNGFMPYISTKMPIDEDTIMRYKGAGMKKIQVSIDSLDAETLVKLLKTDIDYVSRIIKTLDLLEKNDIEVITHTILTTHNSSAYSIRQLVNKLNSYSNISRMRFDFVGYSIYLDCATNLKNMLSEEESKQALAAVEELITDFPKVEIGGIATMENSFQLSEEDFKKRSICSGNLWGFYVLPDGKVTYCEETYWHEKFILGDLNYQSIEEMWNSDLAKGIFYRTKECFQEESVCSSCDDFDDCQRVPGVCWKEIIGFYGTDNWSFPDPRCPKAPAPIYPFRSKQLGTSTK